MEPIQLSIYRDTFEQSEIDGLIDFYKSPTGQAFVNKMPVVMQKAMSAMQIQMQQVMPQITSAAVLMVWHSLVTQDTANQWLRNAISQQLRAPA